MVMTNFYQLNQRLDMLLKTIQELDKNGIIQYEGHGNRINREKHKKIDNKYNCKYCQYSTHCTNNISMHCRKHHSEKPEWKNLNHTIYHCEHCNDKFNYKMNLIEHIHKKHKKIKKECPFCKKKFVMNGVYNHCYKKHTTAIEKEKNTMSEYRYGKIIYDRKNKQLIE